MIQVYRINTGSCGGCDLEIDTAIDAAPDMAWAPLPHDADVLLLTGPITSGSKAALLKLRSEVAHIPLLAIGRCAIDGSPFGKGGLQEHADIQAAATLEGCPPDPHAIAEAIRKQVQP